MPILEGDIRLLASQVMSDVDEGGGAATGTAIVDGASNAMFPDISELDHAYGRVQMRKVFVSVDTADTDTYLGANVILLKPPANPDVSAVLFSTQDDFDRRTAAASRVEAYLAAGPSYAGYLFGNHIAGQMTVSLQQRTNVPLPTNGTTLVLVKSPGAPDEYRQFVRIIDVSSMDRDFTTSSNGADVDFTRTIVSLTISSALEVDFAGFDAIYEDASVTYTGRTELLETVVANAAKYYGVVPLTAAAKVGDFGVSGAGIYAQLVPASRAEVAIADARMNQQLEAVLTTGVDVSFTTAQAIDAGHAAYVGGAITPGTLTLSGSGATVTDKGGTLIDSTGTLVGSVDYANGILSLSTPAVGNAQKTVAYTRGGTTSVVGESIGIDVTDQTRRLVWVITLAPVPAPGTLSVSYLSQGHWYELSDDGSGALRGSDSAFGVGMLNSTTGTVSLTLGALPDAPSSIILQWAPAAAVDPVKAKPFAATSLTVVALAELDMGGALSAGSLAVTWTDGTNTRTATDTNGFLSGDASGTVDYATGVVKIAPNVLPAVGTVLTGTATNGSPAQIATPAFTSSGATWTGSVAAGPGIVPKSLSMTVFVSYAVRTFPGVDTVMNNIPYAVTDDGAGNLQAAVGEVIGSINYATGAYVLNRTFTLHTVQDTFGTVYPLGSGDGYVKRTGSAPRDVIATVQNGNTADPSPPAANATFATSSSGPVTASAALATLTLQTSLMRNGVLSPGASFVLAGHNYLTQPGGAVQVDPSTATGQGVAAGSWVAATGAINVTAWQAGQSSAIGHFAATQSPPTTVAASTPLLTDAVTFRTATAPIAAEGFQVMGTSRAFGDFSVTADANGKIQSDHVFGAINYDTGVVSLRFGTATTDPVGPTVFDVTKYALPGVTNISSDAAAQDSLRYDAVSYSFIPLDASILGLDPVRLPSDGRVPVFRKGDLAVVHYTHANAAQVVADGDTIDLELTRIARVRIIGSDGVTITAGYSADLDAGTVSIASRAGWPQPVTVEYRIEDAALVTDAQISGQLKLSRPLTHAYPLGSFVSSAYLIQDMAARVSALFEQATWTAAWSDTLIGDAPLAAYDQINHPPVVTNAAAVTERWILQFTSATAFSVIGEHLGVVGVGSTATDCAPLNPHTGTPYFHLDATGFGNGWSAGNVIRIDTVGALAPLWVARVVQQGNNTLAQDSFSLLVRGDVNT